MSNNTHTGQKKITHGNFNTWKTKYKSMYSSRRKPIKRISTLKRKNITEKTKNHLHDDCKRNLSPDLQLETNKAIGRKGREWVVLKCGQN